jgi:electron transfer flavoprotein beta subunit
MKIAVLIKQVPGTESSLSLRDDNLWIEESAATYVMNPPDNFALEEALLLKEKKGEGEVVVVSMGPLRTQKVIRESLAKGVDRGIHIEENGEIEKDPLSVSKAFSTVLKEENFDLILTGLQSDDTGMGQTGVLIGENLEMSTSTLVIETDLRDSSVRVKRELESGWFQWVELPLPASISIQSGLNTPRYPSLKGIMGAKKKEIKVFLNSDINSGSKSQNIEKISLPETTKKTEFIEGDSGEVVTRLVNILKNEIKVV